MDRFPLIVCYRYERESLRTSFPPPCRIVCEGEVIAGFPASGILATKHININSDWFREVAMHRLGPNGKVLRIGEA